MEKKTGEDKMKGKLIKQNDGANSGFAKNSKSKSAEDILFEQLQETVKVVQIESDAFKTPGDPPIV